MTQWLRHFRLEQKLLWCNPLFWLFLLLFGAANIYYMSQGSSAPLGGDTYKNLYKFSVVAQTLTLGPAMLLGILLIRRDIPQPSYEWSRSLPISSGALLSAKFMAGLAYLTLFTILASGVFVIFSASEGIEASVYLSHAMHFVERYEISYAVTLALAMLLAMAIPQRLVYLIGFCAWMFGTLFMEAFIIDRYGLYWLKTFHLNQLFVQDAPGIQSEIWGYDLLSDEYLYSNLLVLAFTATLLMVCTVLLNRKRPGASSKRTLQLSVLSFTLTAAVFVPYWVLWSDREASASAVVDNPIADSSNVKPDVLGMFPVKSYDVQLEKTKGDMLNAEVKLEIPAEAVKGRFELYFAINRAFSIKDVTLNNQPASFTREGDHLELILPKTSKESYHLILHYSGKIMDYSPSESGSETYYAFVKGKQVLLPSYIAWLPLPGKQPIYVARSNEKIGLYLRTVIIPESESHIRLTVKGFDAKLYATLPETYSGQGIQRFEGEGAGTLSLFGGGLTEIPSPKLGIKVITTPYEAQSVRQMLKVSENRYMYFADWLPEARPKYQQIFYLPHIVNYFRFNSSFENNSIIDLGNIGYKGDARAEVWADQLLLGSDDGGHFISSEKADARMKIRALFWYLYYRDGKGMSWQEVQPGYYGYEMTSELASSNIGTPMLNQVSDALNEGKAALVKQLLARYYAQGLEVPNPVRFPYLVSKPISYADWLKEWKRVIGHD